jgi:branched-chain amino acid transport system ATP-binding protein
VGLRKVKDLVAGELSYGDQRLLEIILSISLKPKLLLLDEPFSGLGDVEISLILELLYKIKKDFTIVIIEHKISKIEGFVEQLFVMSQGNIICQGKPTDVLCDPEVRRCYWGDVD